MEGFFPSTLAGWLGVIATSLTISVVVVGGGWRLMMRVMKREVTEQVQAKLGQVADNQAVMANTISQLERTVENGVTKKIKTIESDVTAIKVDVAEIHGWLKATQGDTP